jgi:hypothetical protein
MLLLLLLLLVRLLLGSEVHLTTVAATARLRVAA